MRKVYLMFGAGMLFGLLAFAGFGYAAHALIKGGSVAEWVSPVSMAAMFPAALLVGLSVREKAIVEAGVPRGRRPPRSGIVGYPVMALGVTSLPAVGEWMLHQKEIPAVGTLVMLMAVAMGVLIAGFVLVAVDTRRIRRMVDPAQSFRSLPVPGGMKPFYRMCRHMFPELALLEGEGDRRAALWKAIGNRTTRRWGLLVGAVVGGSSYFFMRLDPKWLLPALTAMIILMWVEGLLLGLGLIWLTRGPIRRELRRILLAGGVPVCLMCGYDLRGTIEGRCPECGTPFKLTDWCGPGVTVDAGKQCT